METTESVYTNGHEKNGGAFAEPKVLLCHKPIEIEDLHRIEAFGPMTTIMPYGTNEEAITLANKADGSLVGSLFTADDKIAKEITLGCAPYHGRFMIINRHSAEESTGHGSPMPHLTHGGPGRAGGGEEQGGARAVIRNMQRVALQGSPTTLTTHRRTVTEADIVNFGGLSGDHFYAHFDNIAAQDSLFEERVAHGYFILSAAAGMFVHPAPGPVLLNYGLENLRFLEPVAPGNTIQAKLIVKRKTKRQKRAAEKFIFGVVYWDVEVTNQDNELVADYTILTLVKRKNKLNIDIFEDR